MPWWEKAWQSVKTVIEIAFGDAAASNMSVFAIIVAAVFGWWLYRKLRPSISKGGRMGPHELILLGLIGMAICSLLTLGGYVWLRLVDDETATVNVQQAPSALYHAADINAHIEAVVSADRLLAKYQPVISQCQEFRNHIDQWISDQSAAERLQNFVVLVQPLQDELLAYLGSLNFGEPDIYKSIVDDRYFSKSIGLYSNSLNLRMELLKRTNDNDLINTMRTSTFYVDFINSVTDAMTWLPTSRSKLAHLRAQYRHMPVYENK